MILKKKKKKEIQQNIFHPNNFSRLSQGKRRGAGGRGLMNQASPSPHAGAGEMPSQSKALSA